MTPETIGVHAMAARLLALEQQHRRLKSGFLALLGVLATGLLVAATPGVPAERLVVKGLTVADAHGQISATLDSSGLTVPGPGGLAMVSRSGITLTGPNNIAKVRVSISAVGGIVLSDNEGRIRTILDIGGIRTVDENGKGH